MAPVKHTCPDIDKLIRKIKVMEKICHPRYAYVEQSEWEEAVKDIESELWGMEDDLEQLRSDNAALREWGYSLEEQLNQVQ